MSTPPAGKYSSDRERERLCFQMIPSFFGGARLRPADSPEPTDGAVAALAGSVESFRIPGRNTHVHASRLPHEIIYGRSPPPSLACRGLPAAQDSRQKKKKYIKKSKTAIEGFSLIWEAWFELHHPAWVVFRIVTRPTVNLAETGKSRLPAPFACATFDVPKCADTRLATTRQVLTDDWKRRFWQERHKQWAKYGGPQSFPDNWLIYEFAIYKTFKGATCTFVAGANWLFVISAGY